MHFQAVSSVEETSESPVPMENGHSSSDSNPKPEAEQAPGDTLDTGENSHSNSPTESESYIEESLALSEEQVDCSECRECGSKDSATTAEGVGDERTEATEDEWHAESAENGASGEQECCEGIYFLLDKCIANQQTIKRKKNPSKVNWI